MTQQYQSNPRYLANSLNYNPQMGMSDVAINYLKSYMGINTAPQAQPGMSQYDANTIMASTQRRQLLEQQYKGFNPTAIYAASSLLGNAGVSNPMSYFIGPNGQTNTAGRMVSTMFNQFAGGYASPWANMGAHQNMIIDSLQGVAVGQGSFMRGSLGVSNYQASQLYSQIMGGTYSDKFMTQKRGPFDAGQMMDVFRMGSDRGLYDNAGMGSIALRTQNLGRLIETSRNTFNIADPEQALNAVTDITGGAMPLTQTTQLQDTLNKVKSLARSANISMDVLKEIVSRGAEVSKQLEMSGITGTHLTTTSMQNFKIASSLPGGASDISVARVGGQRNMAIVMSDLQQQFLASDKMKEVAGIVGAYQSMGMDTSSIVSQVNSGNVFSSSQFSNAFDNITNMKAAQIKKSMPNLSDGQVMQMARSQARMAIGQNTVNGQELLASQATQGMTNQMTNEILSNVFFSSTTVDEKGNNVAGPFEDIVKRLKSGGKVSSEEMSLLKTSFMDNATSSFMGMGKSRAESVAAGESLFGRLANAKEFEKRQSMLGQNQAIAQINEQFLESTRSRTGAFGRAITSLTAGDNSMGDILSALLPENLDEFGMRRGASDTIINTLVGSRELVKTFMASPKGMDVYRGLSNVFGASLSGVSQTRKLLDIVKGDMDFSDVELSEKEKNVFRGRVGKDLDKGVLVSLEQVLGGEELNETNFRKAMTFLNKEGPSSHNKILSSIGTFNRSGLGAADLKRIKLQNGDIAKFNRGDSSIGALKTKRLEDLKALSGMDKLSMNNLRKLAESDPEVAKHLNALTMNDWELDTLTEQKINEMTDVGKKAVQQVIGRNKAFTDQLQRRTAFGGEVVDDSKSSAALGIDYLQTFFGQSSLTADGKLNAGAASKLREDMLLHGPQFAVAKMINDQIKSKPELAGEMSIANAEQFGDIVAGVKHLMGGKLPGKIKLPTEIYMSAFEESEKDAAKVIRKNIQENVLSGMSIAAQATILASEDIKGKKGAALTKALKNTMGDLNLGGAKMEDEAYQEVLVQMQKNVSQGLAKSGFGIDDLTGTLKKIEDYNPMIHDALIELNKKFDSLIQGGRMKVDNK